MELLALGVGLCAVAIFVLVLLVLCTRVKHFYPSGSELCALYMKLAVSPLYKRWTWRSLVKPGLKLNPNLAFTLPFKADLQNVRDYINVCEIGWAGQELPSFYIASQFLYPTVCLLSKRAYLFPVLGGIHVSNKFILHKPLPDDKEYTASLKVHEEVELAKKGVNVTFSQLLLDGGESVWVSRTTVLVPARHKYGKAAGEGRANKGKPTTLVEDAEADGLRPKLVKQSTFETHEDTGLRFAAVVSDYNPIHMYTWSARLFGFKRPIAHGMFVAGKAFSAALTEWSRAGLAYPIEIDFKFIKPCFLPGRVTFQIFRADEGEKEPRLMVLVKNADKEEEMHMQGMVRGYKG